MVVLWGNKPEPPSGEELEKIVEATVEESMEELEEQKKSPLRGFGNPKD